MGYFLLAPDMTVDEMWNKFKSVMFDGISKYVSKGTARVTNLKKFQPFTNELRTLIHKNIDYGIVGFLRGMTQSIRIIKLLVIKLKHK